jgi:hypothetical protein
MIATIAGGGWSNRRDFRTPVHMAVHRKPADMPEPDDSASV